MLKIEEAIDFLHCYRSKFKDVRSMAHGIELRIEHKLFKNHMMVMM